ncbi:hypothetical protein [Vibrio hepatarius]|uniref:hypothetical protein n=1 Tax=Vibrio hepatarius TaxID=171383 RepID=UPI001C0A07F7|nr:hypothetical protein [Vibrio hepatarius]MBU2896415.1 hypothetical protein [Vibrio hepatarius]
MSSWDVVSTSVVETGQHSRSQWADVGLILAAPTQNIISTSPHDVQFQNHAGNEVDKPKKYLCPDRKLLQRARKARLHS